METPTAQICQSSGGTVVNSCPGIGGGTSSSGGGISGGTSSSSVGGTARSSSSNTATQFYCDYGYPHSAGGGCFPINLVNPSCDTEYGILSLKCGRTDLAYCNYAASNVSSGGCYNMVDNSTNRSNCTRDNGSVLTECPVIRYQETFYCFEEYYDEGEFYKDCDRIGGWYFSNARECIQYGGAVVTKSFCLGVGAEIFE